VLTKSSIEKDRDIELREGEVRGKILILSPSWDLRMDLPPFFQIGFSSTHSMTVYTYIYRQKGKFREKKYEYEIVTGSILCRRQLVS